ncbi:hypothetical protein QFC21_006789 [Naganishia friedmannii]|uniref:Uncharacterized protein n=1 Tax=Naganishia friedmannii TaxID=89922 RepID=A0ACC2UZN9_9TREE|nr:hypothetical protein QFC21_006789 [Naganishia friedmannii]
MSQSWKQDPHKLLVIPGPIEVADDVLLANAHPSMSHVSPAFAPVFGNCIKLLRQVLYTKDGQPFLVAGSGTLGWDAVGANLIEKGDKASLTSISRISLEVYGADVTQLTAPVGGSPTKEQITEALKKNKYKVLTFTHVDTSTGVLSDPKMIAETVKEVSPDTLVVLDGVCSVASEEIRFDDWGIDVVISATQKGLGVPPGLSVLCASQKAIKVFEHRKTPPSSYYISWKKWLPVMKNYEAGTPSYFATPPVQLIYALETSLKTIMEGKVSLEDRFKMHREASQKFKKEMQGMGFKTVSLSPETSANGMTAVYFPEGFKAPDILPKLLAKDIVVAAGLHKDIKDKYFRVGHMGVTVVDTSRGDMDHVINGIKEAFAEAGYKKST